MVKISSNVDALQIFSVVLANKHEVAVNLVAAVFPQDDAKLIVLIGIRIKFGDGYIFMKL